MNDRLSRRGFLGAGGIVGLGGLFEIGSSGETTATSDPFPEHTHEGAESGGANLRPSALATAQTPVANVKAHGAVGDGETDDTEALRSAVEAATPRGVLYVPHDVDLFFDAPIEIGLDHRHDAHVPFAFICEGTLRPAAGLGEAITIKDGGFIYVNVRIAGGGAPDDSAVVVHSSYWSMIEGVAADYAGTAFELRWVQDGGQVWGIGTMQGVNCGRTLFIDGCGGVGQIDTLVDLNNRELSRIRHPVDLSIDSYLGIASERTQTGFTIESPTSLWIDSLQVSGTDSIDNLTITSPTYARVGSIQSSGGDRGLVVSNAEVLSMDRVLAHHNRVGMSLGANERVRVGIDAHDNDEEGLIVDRVSSRGVRVMGRVCENGAPVHVAAIDGSLAFSDFTATDNASDGDSPVQLVIEGAPNAEIPPEIRFFDSRVPVIEGSPWTVNGTRDVQTVEALEPAEWVTLGPSWHVGDRIHVEDEGVYLRGFGDNWWQIAQGES